MRTALATSPASPEDWQIDEPACQDLDTVIAIGPAMRQPPIVTHVTTPCLNH